MIVLRGTVGFAAAKPWVRHLARRHGYMRRGSRSATRIVCQAAKTDVIIPTSKIQMGMISILDLGMSEPGFQVSAGSLTVLLLLEACSPIALQKGAVLDED